MHMLIGAIVPGKDDKQTQSQADESWRRLVSPIVRAPGHDKAPYEWNGTPILNPSHLERTHSIIETGGDMPWGDGFMPYPNELRKHATWEVPCDAKI